MSNSPNLSTLATQSLDILIECCLEQLALYWNRQLNGADSRCCTEIVQRASRGDKEAFGALWTVSKPHAERMVKGLPASHVEDVVQDVFLRLMTRFGIATEKADDVSGIGPRKQPPVFMHYSQYRSYLKTVVRSVLIDQHRKGGDSSVSTPAVNQNLSSDPALFADRMLLFENILERIDNIQERLVFRQRFGYGEMPREIALSLASQINGLTTEQVSSLLANTLRKLQKDPIAMQLLRDFRELVLETQIKRNEHYEYPND